MPDTTSSKKRIITLVILIIAGETIFLLPFVIARIFRPTLLVVFDITNTELGTYFSVYGVVAMVSYAFGGTLADRFSSRKLMAIALWLTTAGGILMAMVPGAAWMKLIYAFYGFTSIFLFWAAMIRATREWGGSNFQGRAFGWLEGGRGATAALLGTLSFILFTLSSGDASNAVLEKDGFHPFQYVIIAVSGFTFLCGFLVWFIVPDSTSASKTSEKIFQIDKILNLIRLPKMWLLAIMIVCAYVGYKITDDYSLFAKEVMGFSEVASAGVGTAALWMRALVAITAGIIADRFNIVGILSVSYAIAVAGGLLLGLGIMQNVVLMLLLNMALTMIGVYAVRALYFAILKEAGIPLALTGTAVGIVSLVGYTPDVFMSPWMGYLLDNNPGPTGHQYVFLVLAGFSFLGFLTSLIFRGTSSKTKPGNIKSFIKGP